MIKFSKLSVLVITMAIALAMPTGKASAEDSSVTLDLLFLNSDSANYDYAITGYGAAGSGLFNGDVKRVEPAFDAGFRLSYDTGGALTVTLTNVSASDSDSTAGNANVAATQIHSDWPSLLAHENLDLAKADVSLDYMVLDLEMGTPITLGSNAAGKLFAGFRIMDVSNDLEILYIDDVGETANIDKSLEFNGFGVRTGFETKMALGGVYVVTGAAFSLLTGDIETSAQESDSLDGLIYKTDNTDSIVLNVTEMHLGVEFETGSIQYGLGYEFTNIQGLYSVRHPDDVIDTALTNAQENFSLSGFYLRAGMSF